MTPFFVQKEVLGEKIIIRVKYGNVFTQIMMFSLKKVDGLRAREREEKGTTNSAPKALYNIDYFIWELEIQPLCQFD